MLAKRAPLLRAIARVTSSANAGGTPAISSSGAGCVSTILKTKSAKVSHSNGRSPAINSYNTTPNA